MNTNFKTIKAAASINEGATTGLQLEQAFNGNFSEIKDALDELDSRTAGTPEVSIGIAKVWSADNRVVNVRLSGVPKEAVTASSFSVYNAVSGEDIAVNAVSGSGVDYVLTIAQQTQNYGITFID
jgi:hypothetical protein